MLEISFRYDAAPVDAKCWFQSLHSFRKEHSRANADEDYAWSKDGTIATGVFTNSKQVWRQKYAEVITGSMTSKSKALRKLAGTKTRLRHLCSPSFSRRDSSWLMCARTTFMLRNLADHRITQVLATAEADHQLEPSDWVYNRAGSERWMALESRRQEHRVLAARHGWRARILLVNNTDSSIKDYSHPISGSW